VGLLVLLVSILYVIFLWQSVKFGWRTRARVASVVTGGLLAAIGDVSRTLQLVYGAAPIDDVYIYPDLCKLLSLTLIILAILVGVDPHKRETHAT